MGPRAGRAVAAEVAGRWAATADHDRAGERQRQPRERERDAARPRPESRPVARTLAAGQRERRDREQHDEVVVPEAAGSSSMRDDAEHGGRRASPAGPARDARATDERSYRDDHGSRPRTMRGHRLGSPKVRGATAAGARLVA